MLVDLFLLCILALSPAAMFGALCALNAARIGHTRPAIALSFLAIAWGWGAIFFGALDLLMSVEYQTKPVAMLFGMALLAGGNATIFIVNRRECQCTGCPGQRKPASKADINHRWKMPAER